MTALTARTNTAAVPLPAGRWRPSGCKISGWSGLNFDWMNRLSESGSELTSREVPIQQSTALPQTSPHTDQRYAEEPWNLKESDALPKPLGLLMPGPGESLTVANRSSAHTVGPLPSNPT